MGGPERPLVLPVSVPRAPSRPKARPREKPHYETLADVLSDADMVIFDLNELFKGFSLLLEEYEDDLCRAARLRVKDLPPRGEAWREHLLKHDQNIAAQYAVVETVRTAIEGKLHDLGEQLYGLLARIAEAEEAPKVKIGPADKGGPDVCS